MLEKAAIERVQEINPGFYNRLFLVLKASGTWRPVLDVSRLNTFVTKTKFSMETTQSVLDSIQQGDWMVTMDMKDAYFHVPIHEDSRKYLRFSFNGEVFQFRALCFGLSTAPQVFTRVLAPLGGIVHLAGFQIILYLDDWLIIGRSRELVLRAKEFVLNLALELGIVINFEKSSLVPRQTIEYLGMLIDADRFWVFPSKKRTDSALSICQEFLCSTEKQAKSWLSLLGHMSSLEKFIPGARLRMRPLQFHLNRCWDRGCQKTLVPIPEDLKNNLLWWTDTRRLTGGLPLLKKSPDLSLFSDASREGWGGDHRRKTSGRKVVSFRETTPYQFSGTKSNLVSPKRGAALGSGQNSSSICRQHNSSGILNKTGGNQVLVTFPISTGNIPLARREQGDSNAAIHSGRKEHSGRFPEQEGTDTSKRVDVTSGRLPGSLEVVGSSHGGPICHEPHQKATSIHVSTRGPHGHSDRFHVAKLVQHGRLCIPTVRHDPQGPQQISVQHQLQNNSHSPLVASERMVSGTPISNIGTSSSIATQTRSAEPTFSKGKTQKSPHSTTCRMETLQRLTKFKDLSKKVSKAIYESRKPSTNVLYQKRWATFVQWCRAHKVSASKPSINSICEFFIYLFEEKKLVVSTIRCFRSTLHSVLRHTGLKINKNDDIAEVIRSLKLRSPVTNPRIVHWNLDVLLKFLCGEKFEPIRECSILNLTRKTFILLALALSKRVSELQALSRTVGFCKEGALVSLALDFRAKNDFKCKGLARNFLIKELSSLVGQEEEALLCPVRALKAYLERTKPLIDNNVSRLFVSPRFPKNHASKNALTSMTKAVIREVHESLRPDLLPILKVKIHKLRGISTTLAFEKNLSLQKVMEAAQWRCHSVFASHYLKDISFDYDDCRTLGPLLVAGSVIT